MKRSRAGAAAAPVALTVALTAALTGWLTLGLPLLTATASANTPLDWAPVDSVPPLDWLLLFAAPLAVFVVITLLVMGPAWARGERGTPQSAQDRGALEDPERSHRELRS